MSHMKKQLKKDYVLFANKYNEGGDDFFSFDRKGLDEVPNLECGVDKPLSSGDGFADYSVIEMRLRALAGKILTVIDASIPEGQQNKCVKDLVRDKIMEEYTFWGEELFDQDRLNEMALESIEGTKLTQVSDKEILGA